MSTPKAKKPDPSIAERALKEAEERRRQRDAAAKAAPSPEPELNGQDGPDPARYGDWEKGGLISDF